MNAHVLPIEQSFPTGNQGKTLVLLVCAGWIWAGLYASPYSITPIVVSAATRLVASVRGQRLRIGACDYPLSKKSMQSARRWLDRQGVAVRDQATREIA